MKCKDVRIFFTQITEKSVSMPIIQSDMDFFNSKGFLSVMEKQDYDQAAAEVSNLTQMNIDKVNAENADRSEKAALQEDEKKTHSITFLFEAKESKDAEREKVESEKGVASKMDAAIAEEDAKINDLITKKSMVDRMVPYGGKYLALTGPGIMML